MNRETLNKRFKALFNQEPSDLVNTQINKLQAKGYSLLQISNAIWYTFVQLGLQNNLSVYGIHYVSQKIDESNLFFESLAAKAERTHKIVEERTENEILTVKRQKQRLVRKEYDWDNVE